jgi:hypothetical protein
MPWRRPATPGCRFGADLAAASTPSSVSGQPPRTDERRHGAGDVHGVQCVTPALAVAAAGQVLQSPIPSVAPAS